MLEVGIVAAWATAEALVWPIMPDAVIVPLAYRSPGRWWTLALGAAAGTALGGTLTYVRGRQSADEQRQRSAFEQSRRPADEPLPPLIVPSDEPLPPLVRPRMVLAVRDWLSVEGPSSLRRQPASGVPFKVFAREAGSQGVPLGPFLLWAVGARSVRFALAGGLAALAGRYAPAPIQAYPRPLLASWALAFGFALRRTVTAWSGPIDQKSGETS